jgi:hypothetical protein
MQAFLPACMSLMAVAEVRDGHGVHRLGHVVETGRARAATSAGAEGDDRHQDDELRNEPWLSESSPVSIVTRAPISGKAFFSLGRLVFWY